MSSRRFESIDSGVLADASSLFHRGETHPDLTVFETEDFCF